MFSRRCNTPPQGKESLPASRACFTPSCLTDSSPNDRISRLWDILRVHARLCRAWRHPYRRNRRRRSWARCTWGRAALSRGPRQSGEWRPQHNSHRSRNARTQATAEQAVFGKDHLAGCCARGRGLDRHRISGPERLAIRFAGNPRGRAASLRQTRICARPARARAQRRRYQHGWSGDSHHQSRDLCGVPGSAGGWTGRQRLSPAHCHDRHGPPRRTRARPDRCSKWAPGR